LIKRKFELAAVDLLHDLYITRDRYAAERTSSPFQQPTYISEASFED